MEQRVGEGGSKVKVLRVGFLGVDFVTKTLQLKISNYYVDVGVKPTTGF